MHPYATAGQLVADAKKETGIQEFEDGKFSQWFKRRFPWCSSGRNTSHGCSCLRSCDVVQDVPQRHVSKKWSDFYTADSWNVSWWRLMMRCQSVVQELTPSFSVTVANDCHVSKASGKVPLFILLDLLQSLIQLMASPWFFATCRTPHSLEFLLCHWQLLLDALGLGISFLLMSKCLRLQGSACRPSLRLICPQFLVISWL